MPAMPWISDAESRVGLGCMRLSTDEDRDEARALATIAAAVEAGMTVFDTARAYGHGPDRPRPQRAAARPSASRLAAAESDARIVTKGGMSREGGGGSRTGAPSRYAPTARRAWSLSTVCRSTSISSTRRIRGRPGAPRSERSRDSSTTGSCGTLGSRTSPATSWTRHSSSRRSPRSRSRSARSTTARYAEASSSAAPSRRRA